MARYLAALAVIAVMLACFSGDVSAVSDQEFQMMQNQLHDLSMVVESQASKIIDLEEQLKAALGSSETVEEPMIPKKAFEDEEIIQNATIEERVTLLELQMTDVQGEVVGLDEDVNFLFGEQLIQDERILTLEQDTDQIEDDVESLQVAALELDFRVTVLEENGGSGGNSSISELEERVETLEGTATDHEARITSTETDLEGLGVTSDHETRLTEAEKNIQGLQMTDISLDARITALEENGGDGGSQNETIAFYAVLTSYTSIPPNTAVEFNEIVLNEGNGYDSTRGIFTVPPGGDGLYYFSTYLRVDFGEYGFFDMRLNDDVICSANGDHNSNGASDASQATCSAVVSVIEGDEVAIMLRNYTDDTPLDVSTGYYSSGFTGFSI